MCIRDRRSKCCGCRAPCGSGYGKRPTYSCPQSPWTPIPPCTPSMATRWVDARGTTRRTKGRKAISRFSPSWRRPASTSRGNSATATGPTGSRLPVIWRRCSRPCPVAFDASSRGRIPGSIAGRRCKPTRKPKQNSSWWRARPRDWWNGCKPPLGGPRRRPTPTSRAHSGTSRKVGAKPTALSPSVTGRTTRSRKSVNNINCSTLRNTSIGYSSPTWTTLSLPWCGSTISGPGGESDERSQQRCRISGASVRALGHQLRAFPVGDAGLQPELLVAAVPPGRSGEDRRSKTYDLGHGASALSVCGGQDLAARRAGGNQLQRSISGERVVPAAHESTPRHHGGPNRIPAGARYAAVRLKRAYNPMHKSPRKSNHLQRRVLKGENRLDSAKHQGANQPKR